MISQKALINGNKWKYSKKDFLKLFQQANSVDEKKAVLKLLFEIEPPKNTGWEPVKLIDFNNQSHDLILEYKLFNIIPAATIEDFNKVVIGPAVTKKLTLTGFHQYQYVEIPTFDLQLWNLNSFWVNQNYLVMQINKTEKQLQQYFAQVVRHGIRSQDDFANQILNLALKNNLQLLEQGLALRCADGVSGQENQDYNAPKTFYLSKTKFATTEEFFLAIQQLVRDNAVFGSQNALAILL
ncbi:hypothetical protein NV226_02655 [Mycoplasma iguanae]|uniref:Uncharacterized protein n=1 Tax=Mycoplasma iguanae TaxID=292461 RepID=A0ABY5RAG1_9MOLU|nr:hypothetical protein [Mycoplasma iguanae]UVD81600.1 hypothetical protein NV226_02655 [Mycoplasma iguanae]